MDRLQQHFAQFERGEIGSLEQCRSREAPRPQVVPIEEIPTLHALTESFSQLKSGKAPGLTGLVAELYRAAPAEAARTHWPLLAKTCARGRGPLLWKGGIARAIPKPHKCLGEVTGWRNILLQEPAGKAVARVLREPLEKAFRAQAREGTGGGIKARPMELSSLMVRLHFSRAKAAGRSAAVLFVDGQQAFYSTLREYLWGRLQQEGGLEQAVQRLLDGIHVDSQICDRAKQLLSQPGRLVELGVSSSLNYIFQAQLTGAWYCMNPQAQQVVQSFTGTGPGSPLADILFQVVFDISLRSLEQSLREAGMLQSPLTNGGDMPSQSWCPCYIPTWVDDLAILIDADAPTELMRRLEAATRAAHVALGLAGIAVNHSPRKTEAVLAMRGKGSQEARRQAWVREAGVHEVEVAGRTIRLVLASSYLHLGTTVCASSTDAPDLRSRGETAWAKFLPVRRRVLTNPELSISERMQVVDSLVLNSLMHGAGVWTLATSNEREMLHAAYMRIMRGCMKPLLGTSVVGLTDQDVCSALCVLNPEENLWLHRARLLMQLVRSDCYGLWFVSEAESFWLHQAGQALYRVCYPLLGQPATNVECVREFRPCRQWMQQAKQHAAALTFAVQSFRARILRARQTACRAVRRRIFIARSQLQDGIVAIRIPTGVCRQHSSSWTCPECHQMFANAAAGGSHMRHMHARPAVASAAVGTACQCCCVEFWSTRRLRQHLRQQPSCGVCYAEADLGCEAPHPDVDDGWRPPSTVAGPRPWWATLQPTARSSVVPPMSLPLPPYVCHFARACRDWDFEKIRQFSGATLVWNTRVVAAEYGLYTWPPDIIGRQDWEAIFGTLSAIVEAHCTGTCFERQVLGLRFWARGDILHVTRASA